MLDVTMSVHAGDYQVVMEGVVIHVDNTTHMIWLSTNGGVACVPMAMVTSVKNGEDMWFSTAWAGVEYPMHARDTNPFIMNPDTVPDGILDQHERIQSGKEVKPLLSPADDWVSTALLSPKVSLTSFKIGDLK